MFKLKNTWYLLKLACKLKPTITVIWDAYIKVVVYQYFIKKSDDILECINENKCAIFFISHT